MTDLRARQAATDRITKLCALIKACDAMIEEEQRLIGSPIPYADNQHMRVNAALHRAAFGVFECDDLHHMACDIDPDWMQPVSPVRAGLCRSAAA